MKVNIIFVKIDGDKRTEIPLEDMTQEELAEQGLKLKKRFFETLGYVPKENTA